MNETTAYVEQDCTIEHEGHAYTASGAAYTDDYCIGYPGTNGVFADWHGNPLGTWREVSSWSIVSYISTRMYQIEATINGVTYTGRGLGLNMIYRGKRKANQS